MNVTEPTPAAAPTAAGEATREGRDALDKAMATKQYVIRHSCGQPVRLCPTRRAATAAVDQVPTPLRFQLRVHVAARTDVLAALQQRHCTHLPR